MSVNKNDLNELKRMVTNTYDDDKKCLQRIVVGITQMDRKITQLQAELASLKAGKTKQ